MASAQQKFQERRIIILGRTGNGKSSTANSLCCSTLFPAGRGLTGMTQTCLKKTWTDTLSNFTYEIVDTPGLFDTGMSLGQAALEIQKSVTICPKPHAFLLVFSAHNRFTDEEILAVDYLQVIFGEGVLDHCIIVFTHGDDFEDENDFRTFWKDADFLAKLVERCNGRITYIENRPRDGNYPSRKRILVLIEEMCLKGTKRFEFPMLQCHKSVLEEHLRSFEGNRSVKDELNFLVEKLCTKLGKELWKQRMTKAVGAATAFGLGIGLFYVLGPAKIVTAGAAAVATALKR